MNEYDIAWHYCLDEGKVAHEVNMSSERDLFDQTLHGLLAVVQAGDFLRHVEELMSAKKQSEKKIKTRILVI
jgi:hypothetical protein